MSGLTIENEIVRLFDPPQGKVQQRIEERGVSFIEWAPGNGYVYRLVVARLPSPLARQLAGEVLISVCVDGDRYVSYPANPGGLYESTYVADKWLVRGEPDQLLVVVLMNWALFGPDSYAADYAAGLWGEAVDRGFVPPHARAGGA